MIAFSFVMLGCGQSQDSEPVSSSHGPKADWVADKIPDETATGESIAQARDRSAKNGSQSEKANREGSDQVFAQGTIFRPEDDRPNPDPARLKSLGIEIYESQRLRLYTDIDPAIAKSIPPIVDQLYEAWIDYFGELPPNRKGTDFQISGYLIKERDRFTSADLLPVELEGFQHGQHRGQEFWMYEQEHDYYRRHLVIHEATHCFMMLMPGTHPPYWYLEGMAEFFGTHRLKNNGTVEFGVMPESSKNYRGFGRVQMIQNAVASGEALSVDGVTGLGEVAFSRSRSTPYAWSWAFCKFLDTHPRYQVRFRELANHLVGTKFFELADESFLPDKALLQAEWNQFVDTIEYGWDVPQNMFRMHQGEAKPFYEQLEIDVHANQGWQSSSILIPPSTPVSVEAEGTVTLADQPKPWMSEPQGVSIRYTSGVPIGRLQAGVLIDSQRNPFAGEVPFEVFDVGTEGSVRSEYGGLLMFRVNDFPSERADNRGAYKVTISNVAE